MPKKQAGLPDLKTRFGWLPGANKVDPQIYTQLDPTAMKGVPDYSAQDPESAQPDIPTGTIPKIPDKTPPPGTGGPGGGGPGGNPPVVPPPYVPPELPPPVPPPPEKVEPIDTGQSRHPVKPVRINPGQEWNPIIPPRVPPPKPVNPGQSIEPPPPTTPINTGQSWEPPIGWDPTPSHPIGTGQNWELPPPTTPIDSGQSWETIPGRGPTGPTTGPSVIQKPGQPVEVIDSTFKPYEGGEQGPPVGPPLGGTGWTLGGENAGGGYEESGNAGMWEIPGGGFITSPGGTGSTGSTGSITGTSETIDFGQGKQILPGGTGSVNPWDDYDFARGGIIMKPRIGRVGERGPEAIMKLGPRMPGGWEEPMRPGKLPYQAMRYTRKGEGV